MCTDFHPPEIGIHGPDAYQHETYEKGPHPRNGLWWNDFNNPELNQIVDQVLKNNLDIKKAAAKVLEVQSQFVQIRAARFPGLNLSGDTQRQKKPVIGIIPGQRYSVRNDVHALSLPSSFELDLWGRLACAEEAARADLLQAEENRQTISQTVVAEAVTLYLQIESYERRIQIAQKNIQSSRNSLALVKRRYERGLSTILDLKQARRILAQAETLLPSLRQELGIIQQKMAVLMGAYPRIRSPRTQPEDYYKRLDPVPSGLPSDLLRRRPDIRAAEEGLKALNARVGVAKASRFPKISLTGNLGYTSEELDCLLNSESELWRIAAGISQPLFDAGRLKANQRAAEARYEQGLAEYAKTVLTAFSEVEKALLTRKEQLARRDRVLVFLAEARAVERVAEIRYKRGLVDYLTVLDSQQTRFQAEDSLVLVDLAIMANRVSLHRAIGTGWAEVNDASGRP